VSPITDTMEESEVRKALGLSPRTLDRIIAAGEFPEALSITAQVKMWLRADVEWFIYGKGVKGRLRQKGTPTNANATPTDAKSDADED